MEVLTPNRPPGGIDTADFTRPQEPSSPSNLHAAKRQRGKSILHMPPPVYKGASASTANPGSAARTLRGHLDEEERQAKTRREVLAELATMVDKLVDTQKSQDKRAYATTICNRFIQFIAIKDYTTTDDYVPMRVRSQPTTTTASATSGKTSSKSVAWGAAQTPKNLGGGPTPARAHNAGQPMPNLDRTAPTTATKSARSGSTMSTNARDDRRVLITLPGRLLLARPEAYAVRQALVKCVPGLTTLSAIPRIDPTRTGWAVIPSDLTTRDLLVTEEAVSAIKKTLDATDVCIPQKWYNYAVPGVPSTVASYDGTRLETGTLMADEVLAQ
ncbi:hypothetical protein P175DRAFT_0404742, partial [Aspergillus ochraceoroseus IBT 24754]